MSSPDQALDFQMRAQALAEGRRQDAPSKGRKRKKRVQKRAGAAPMINITASHMKALATGILIIALARLARFYLSGAPMLDQGGNTYWISDIVISFAAIYVIAKIIDWQCRAFMWWNFAGVMIMLTTMHNLVHYKPALFTQIFSPSYVETVLVNTTPNSIVFRGMIIDKNGFGSLATGEEGLGGCGVDTITGLIGGDLVKSMSALNDACL